MINHQDTLKVEKLPCPAKYRFMDPQEEAVIGGPSMRAEDIK